MMEIARCVQGGGGAAALQLLDPSAGIHWYLSSSGVTAVRKVCPLVHEMCPFESKTGVFSTVRFGEASVTCATCL